MIYLYIFIAISALFLYLHFALFSFGSFAKISPPFNFDFPLQIFSFFLFTFLNIENPLSCIWSIPYTVFAFFLPFFFFTMEIRRRTITQSIT